ncbi:cysteine desulfurase family protein [Stanieria cyanosphaera PCC 7437]|uniref:Cysteine desulfurase family protein n=1 Tax=Stanieria cyanosphaera (strain ATCC 29371 / PCC 7437) TaxID=111780 RepID=K9Y0B4_STAC7|nr:cysteine desulfurase-like protein [Stanieria cyanosphaera]AFZ37734.1 cysteine desulfurase family protein [Stanieria cyanosphaera PCC 7437]
MVGLDLKKIRAQFPALDQEINGEPVIFFDGPGGTQVPDSVMKAMSDYLRVSNANAHGEFATSRRTDELIDSARLAMADFLGCSPDEIVFGANMTTLTFSLSRAIARELKPGDEIIVTQLDHYANVSPWLALEEQGVVIRTVNLNVEDCTLDLTDLKQKVNERTKLVAVGYASNAVGTINNVAEVVKIAHAVNALVFIDAVHYAPHGLIDVRELDCDFLTCSAYKFFGPHVGVLYGKRKHFSRLRPYKVKPAPKEIPACWETGTLNYEGLAGVVATIDYLADLGRQILPSVENRRTAIVTAMTAIANYERELCQHLITKLLQIPGLTFYGISAPQKFNWRTPTVAIRLREQTPYAVAKALGDRGIFTWHGNFYALGLTERLGIESSGGLLRIGLVHYNSIAEIDRLLTALLEIAALPTV